MNHNRKIGLLSSDTPKVFMLEKKSRSDDTEKRGHRVPLKPKKDTSESKQSDTSESEQKVHSESSVTKK